jgi:hypothetical protein
LFDYFLSEPAKVLLTYLCRGTYSSTGNIKKYYFVLFIDNTFKLIGAFFGGYAGQKNWAEVGGRKRGVKTPARSIVIILKILRRQQVKSSVSEKNIKITNPRLFARGS